MDKRRVAFAAICVYNDGDLIGAGELDFRWGIVGNITQKSAILTTGDDLHIDDEVFVGGDGRRAP